MLCSLDAVCNVLFMREVMLLSNFTTRHQTDDEVLEMTAFTPVRPQLTFQGSFVTNLNVPTSLPTTMSFRFAQRLTAQAGRSSTRAARVPLANSSRVARRYASTSHGSNGGSDLPWMVGLRYESNRSFINHRFTCSDWLCCFLRLCGMSLRLSVFLRRLLTKCPTGSLPPSPVFGQGRPPRCSGSRQLDPRL
jgi:hypothetical protein